MTIEEKELLLKDLCSRLLYGIIVDYKENKFETPHWKIKTIYPETFDGWIGYDEKVGAGSESGSRYFKIGQYRPYIRPMSSMTEDEKETYYNLCYEEEREELEFGEWAARIHYHDTIESIDYLNSIHADYRGLIEKGLALEATEDMYK